MCFVYACGVPTTDSLVAQGEQLAQAVAADSLAESFHSQIASLQEQKSMSSRRGESELQRIGDFV